MSDEDQSASEQIQQRRQEWCQFFQSLEQEFIESLAVAYREANLGETRRLLSELASIIIIRKEYCRISEEAVV